MNNTEILAIILALLLIVLLSFSDVETSRLEGLEMISSVEIEGEVE